MSSSAVGDTKHPSHNAPAWQTNQPLLVTHQAQRRPCGFLVRYLLLATPGLATCSSEVPRRVGVFPKLLSHVCCWPSRNAFAPGLSLCYPGSALSNLFLNTWGVGSSAGYLAIRTPPYPVQFLLPSALWALFSMNRFARSCVTSQTVLHLGQVMTLVQYSWNFHKSKFSPLRRLSDSGN